MRIDLGDVQVDVLSDGRFRLDGGAMFGVVPKVLWEKRKRPDALNRITLGLNCLLIRGSGPLTLVDTGIGVFWDEKRRQQFGIERTPGLETELARVGVRADEIELVINTHLHFDHAGGNTHPDGEGGFRLSYPNARYVVQRGNLEKEARCPNALRRASYLPHTFEPVAKAGRWWLVDGEEELWPGVRVVPTPGHALFHQSVVVEGSRRRLFYPADMMPTAAHLDPPWIMAYDHEPLRTLAYKEHWLPLLADKARAIVVLEHEHEAPVGQVVREGRRYRWKPLTEQEQRPEPATTP